MQWEMEWDIRWDTIESFFADIPFYVCPTPYVSYSVYIPLRMYSTPCVSLRMCQTPCASHSMCFPLMCLSHSISGSVCHPVCVPLRVFPAHMSLTPYVRPHYVLPMSVPIRVRLVPYISRSCVSHSVSISVCVSPMCAPLILWPTQCVPLGVFNWVSYLKCVPLRVCSTPCVSHSVCVPLCKCSIMCVPLHVCPTLRVSHPCMFRATCVPLLVPFGVCVQLPMQVARSEYDSETKVEEESGTKAQSLDSLTLQKTAQRCRRRRRYKFKIRFTLPVHR